MKKSERLLFLATTALFWFSLYTYPVLLSNFAQGTLGATPAMIGSIVGSYGLVQMLLRTPLGFFSDRLRRRKPFLTLGLLFSTLAALGLWFSQSPLAAMLARGTSGAAAAAWVAFSVLFASYGAQGQPGTGVRQRGGFRAMGVLSAVMCAAQLVATQAGGWLANSADTRAAFLLAVGAGVLGMLCSLFVIDVRPTAQPASPRALLTVVKSRSLLVCSLLSILQQVIMWSTLYGFSPQWAKTVLGADASQLALLSTFHLLPNVLCSWLTGAVLVPRLGARRVTAIGFACMAVSCLGMPLTNAFWQMLALQIFAGIGVGCIGPVTLALCMRDSAPEQHGMAMGLFQSLYGIGMFAGPVLAGALVTVASPVVEGVAQLTVGYRANFYAMAAVGVLGLLCALRLMPRERPE